MICVSDVTGDGNGIGSVHREKAGCGQSVVCGMSVFWTRGGGFTFAKHERGELPPSTDSGVS